MKYVLDTDSCIKVKLKPTLDPVVRLFGINISCATLSQGYIT